MVILRGTDLDDHGPVENSVSGFRSNHEGRFVFLYADGSARLQQQDIDMTAYRAFATIAGQEPIAATYFDN